MEYGVGEQKGGRQIKRSYHR